MTEKLCPKCGATKAVAAFSRNRSKKDGLGSYCSSCAATAQRASRQRHPDTARAWRERNRDQINEYRRENYDRRQKWVWQRWYRKNAERVVAYQREWYWANLDRAREASRIRQSERRALVGRPDQDAREYMRLIVGDPCSYCGHSGGEIDHVDAVAQGGDGSWANLTGACRRCNASKGDQPLLRFLLTSASPLLTCGHRSPLYGYRRGCRCDTCLAATREYKREWKASRG